MGLVAGPCQGPISSIVILPSSAATTTPECFSAAVAHPAGTRRSRPNAKAIGESAISSLLFHCDRPSCSLIHEHSSCQRPNIADPPKVSQTRTPPWPEQHRRVKTAETVWQGSGRIYRAPRSRAPGLIDSRHPKASIYEEDTRENIDPLDGSLAPRFHLAGSSGGWRAPHHVPRAPLHGARSGQGMHEGRQGERRQRQRPEKEDREGWRRYGHPDVQHGEHVDYSRGGLQVPSGAEPGPEEVTLRPYYLAPRPSILRTSSSASENPSLARSSSMWATSVVPVSGSMPTCRAKRKMTCARVFLCR